MTKQDKEINKLLFNLSNTLNKLKDKYKVIRSARFTGEIGEYLVTKKFKLKQAKPGEKGFDAKKGKKRIQIKTRSSIFNPRPTNVSTFSNFNFDVCWRVVLNKNFQLKDVWEIPVKEVKKILKDKKDKTRFNFSKKIRDIKGVRRIYPKKRHHCPFKGK